MQLLWEQVQVFKVINSKNNKGINAGQGQLPRSNERNLEPWLNHWFKLYMSRRCMAVKMTCPWKKETVAKLLHVKLYILVMQLW